MAIDRYQSSVSLLMRLESTLNDETTNANVFTQPGGAVAYSTTNQKFGAGCMQGSGGSSGKYATIPMVGGAALDLFNGDFTVEFWLYCGSVAVGVSQFLQWGDWTNGVTPKGFGFFRSSATLTVQPANGTYGTVMHHANAITTGSWHHVAFTRSGTTGRLFMDGVLGATQSWPLVATTTSTIIIGGDTVSSSNNDYLASTDYIDELRITKGVARYTADFTPLTVAFPYLPAGSTTYLTSPTDPNYWSDGVNIPPANYSATNNNFAFTTAGGIDAAIAYIGDYTKKLPTTLYLDWSLTGNTSRGAVYVNYSLDGGVTYTAVDIGTGISFGSSAIAIATSGATRIAFYLSGATGASATISTRTVDENCTCTDTTELDTLSNLRTRMMRRLGFSAMVNNPPPGMTELLNEFLASSQKFLYRKYSELRTKRFFNWQMTPGTRFYCYNGNTEDMAGLHMDPYKSIDYVGVVLTNGAWIPLYEGIPPTVYTMVSKQGIPARYERRQCIEVFPAPNDYYQLVVKGHFGLQSFTADGDYTTIDSELVFLYALATAKAHYSQADAGTVAGLAKDYLGQLIAGTHGKHTYLPGTIPAVPAVQPVFLPLINP